jgi:predicted protein tyrosine phosphatase
MTVGTLKIDGRKFRIISEDEYKAIRASMRLQQRQAREDTAELAQAQRRIKDPNRKVVPLARLKAELGL